MTIHHLTDYRKQHLRPLFVSAVYGLLLIADAKGYDTSEAWAAFEKHTRSRG